MGRIAQQYSPFFHPGITPERSKRACGIAKEIINQARHQRNCIGKIFLKKRLHPLFGIECRETGFAFPRHKQGAGEIPASIGKRYHHVAASWPNVQVIFIQTEIAEGIRRNFQFLVAVVFVGLGIVKPTIHKGIPHRAEYAIGTNNNIGFIFYLVSMNIGITGNSGLWITKCAFMVEI